MKVWSKRGKKLLVSDSPVSRLRRSSLNWNHSQGKQRVLLIATGSQAGQKKVRLRVFFDKAARWGCCFVTADWVGDKINSAAVQSGSSENTVSQKQDHVIVSSARKGAAHSDLDTAGDVHTAGPLSNGANCWLKLSDARHCSSWREL